MATLNERIREVRKTLNLSQKELAGKIGISQRAISWGEQPGNNVPDSTIKSLCIILHVNESWLRTGNGSMFTDIDALSLDKIARDNGCTALEFKILKIYFEMDRATRLAVARHFRERLSYFMEGEDLDAPIFEAGTINPPALSASPPVVQTFSVSDNTQEPSPAPFFTETDKWRLMNTPREQWTEAEREFIIDEFAKEMRGGKGSSAPGGKVDTA